MIQDLGLNKYDLNYYNIKPKTGDYILEYSKYGVVLNNNQILKYNDDIDKSNLTFAFKVNDKNYFIDLTIHEEGIPINVFRTFEPRYQAFAIITGYHLFNFLNKNKYCGVCGKKLMIDIKQRKLTCTCGNEIFPTIAPAVIVGLIHNNRILLTKYRNGSYSQYALVAGFTEIGECFEDTIKREVFEEVGLHVTKTFYYKSQPWGLSGSVLAGYYAYVDDIDDTPTLQLDELKEAKWFTKEEIDLPDDKTTLTREMILNFKNNM